MRRAFICVLLTISGCLSAVAATYTVTTTKDGVEGSLRWAVEQASQEEETSIVEFALSSADTVFLDTTIQITSSVKIDGRSNDGGKVVVVPSAEKYVLFDLGKYELDSVVFEDLKFQRRTFKRSINELEGFANVDSTRGEFVLRDCDFKYLESAIKARGSSVDIVVAGCTFDSIVSDCITSYYENEVESWHTLKLYESHFTNVFSNVVAGGKVKNTPLLEVKKCLFEKCYFGFVGNSAEMIFSRCEFIDTKCDAIDIGCDDNCQAEVLIDSCRIINSGWYGFQCYMDGSEVSITNSEIYGSGWEDVKTLRQRYSNYYSKLHFENNVFGSPEFGGSGVIVDASHTVLRNNVFYGINGVSDYLGVNAYALYDQGSDTLLIEQNSFGFKGEEKFPNKHGDLWLESELGYNLKFWIKDGCYYDPDPKITIRNNTFLQSSPKAIRIDSTRLNISISENLFLETKDSAICNVKPLSVPVITNVSKQGDNIIVAGKVDSIATIELFYTSGAPQTAEAFLGRVETDPAGGFSFSIPVESVKDKDGSLCFTATATYPCRATSNLSEVYCATFNDSKIADNVSSKIIVLTPNLVSSYLKTGIAEDVSYQIYSVDGCLVMSGRTAGGTIEVSHLLQGIYWLRLIDGKEVKVAKFVKESTMN